MEAETTTILVVLRVARDRAWYNLEIETDSRLLLQIIKRKWRCPWDITDCVEKIRDNMGHLKANIHHIFKEGNQLADYLANLAFEHQDKQIFYEFKELPNTARKIINSDKSQIPYIRIRTRQIQVEKEDGLQAEAHPADLQS